MNLDDELQRLFADERLDVPVRHGATEAVVAGARRVRRRRIALSAVGGAAALSLLAGTAIVLAKPGPAHSVPGAEISATGEVTATATERSDDPAPTSVNAPGNSGTRTGSVTGKPTSSTTVPPSDFQPEDGTDGTVPFGPDGYLALRLGMTAEQAEATGLITPNVQPISSKGCKGYDYKGTPKEAARYAVVISPTYGLVRLANGPLRPLTTEGLILGSSETDMKKAYPTSAGTHGAVGEWVTQVPGNADKRYWFLVRDGKVSEMRLELATQDCYF